MSVNQYWETFDLPEREIDQVTDQEGRRPRSERSNYTYRVIASNSEGSTSTPSVAVYNVLSSVTKEYAMGSGPATDLTGQATRGWHYIIDIMKPFPLSIQVRGSEIQRVENGFLL